VASITLTPPNPALVPQQTVPITATLRDAAGNVLTGRAVTWGSSLPSIATINASGLVTGQSVGATTISANSESAPAGTVTVTVKEGAMIGASGGAVSTINNTVSLIIPNQALAATTPIWIAPLQNPPPDPSLVPGTAFDFGPSGTQFAQPVTVTIKYNPALLSGSAHPALFRLARMTGAAWTALAGSTVDQALQTVTGQTASFSAYAVIEIPPVTGTLCVVVNGLPGGVPAQGTITGPGGFNQPLTGNQACFDTTPGSYSVTPAEVTSGGSSYSAAAQSGTVNAAQTTTITVTYVAVVNPVLTIAGGGAGTGTGRVTSLPAGIDCTITTGTPSGTCNAAFARNTVVEVQVASGTLASWSDGCTGAALCQVTMSQDQRVVATFALPPIIVLKTTKPVVVADRVQQNLTIQYSIQNGGNGALLPTVSPASPKPWLTLSVVGSNTLQLVINASGLLPFSEANTPYVASAKVSSPGAADVPITIKFARTFDQPAGMAATVVRFHRYSGGLSTDTPPANVNALVDLLDARTNTRVPAQIVEPVDPDDQNWLEPPTINASGQLVLQVQPFSGLPIPFGNLPSPPGNLLGTPIRIKLIRADGTSQCPAFSVPPDPSCQVFVYYTADPYPKLLLRPWGVQLTPGSGNDTKSAAIEVQPGGPGTTIDTPQLLRHDCGTRLAQSPTVTATQVTVKGNFTSFADDAVFRCTVKISATYRDDTGAAIAVDSASLLVTLAKPSPDAITPSQRDLNILATAGAAGPAPDDIVLNNLGPNVIALGSVVFVSNTCPSGVLATPIIAGTTLGQGQTATVSITVNPLGQAKRTCSATLRISATTPGVLSQDIPVSVRLK
jgi:hypothetical protein